MLAAGGHQPQRGAAQGGPVVQEGGDGRRALVLVGLGWHGEPGVAGEQGEHGRRCRRARRRRRSGRRGGARAGESGSGARSRSAGSRACERRPGALQGAFDGGFGGVEDAGRLGGREAEHVPEHEDRPLLGWQVLQAGHERQRDRLLGVVPGLGAGGVGYPAEQSSGRARATRARGLCQPGSALGGWPSGRHLLRAAGFAAQVVQAAVGGDPVQPRPQRGPAVEPVRSNAMRANRAS